MEKKFHLSTTQTIMSAFLAAILIGSLLLSLPVSSAGSAPVSYIDALFTAATSVCVTGLVTVPTVTTWSVFGQVVILLLIQAGGLGIITVMTAFMISLHKKMGIVDRMLIQETFNLNTLSGTVRFLKRVLIGTFAVEGIGALMYMTVFIPEYGLKGIWLSVFNSISAFCNAGIDLLSENSLCDYVVNPVVNITTMMLIILGGIGFIVWWDVAGVIRKYGHLKLKCLRFLTLHSKIALSATFFLIVSGGVLFFIFERNNPATIGNYSLPQKLMVSLFQSVTTRTAGFATVSQHELTNASSVTALLLMFIGGSPTGTAGGVKTVTMAVLLASTFATITNRENVVLFGRTVTKQAVTKASAVVFVSFMIMFISTVSLAAATGGDILDIVYETVSATATVGLTRDFTPTLNLIGKIIVTVNIYLGRVGPISLFIALNTGTGSSNIVKNPTETISVG